jgi:membrane protein involved in colicin uptake
MLALQAGTGLAQPQGAGPGIYTCVTADGRRITSDRPIIQCLDREQQERRSDGTIKRVIPPQQTAEERARMEALERMRAEERARVDEAARRDKTLMQRYPNEAAHRVAREKDLAAANEAIAVVRRRITELETERKALLTEAEFFRKGNMPAALKRKLDENDINMGGALRTVSTQQGEITKINERFDAELARLKRLWAGEAPGFGVATAPR